MNIDHEEAVLALDAIHPDPANPNKHPERNLDAIKASLERFGQREPILVQAGTDRIIGGHGRLEAMRALGWKEALVWRLPLNDTQAAALGIALNRTAELAVRDEDALASILQTLPGEDLWAAGYTSGELDDLLARVAPPDLRGGDEEPPEPPAPPRDPVTRIGDRILLGDHVLVCGDASDAATAKKALQGHRVHVVFTDPPYGIAYQDVKKKHRSIEGDEEDPRELVAAALRHAAPAKETPVFVCCDWRSLGSMRAALANVGVQEKAVVVWDKVNPAQHLDRYFKQHEFILYAGPYGGEETLRGDVWQFPRQVSDLHPTMKPVALVAQAIRDSSRPGGVVFDPFLGSGSTLMAAEQLGRRCVGIELDPAYCDVVVQRWEDYTGKEAKRPTEK